VEMKERRTGAVEKIKVEDAVATISARLVMEA
jgi:hypothetical protein